MDVNRAREMLASGSPRDMAVVFGHILDGDLNVAPLVAELEDVKGSIEPIMFGLTAGDLALMCLGRAAAQ